VTNPIKPPVGSYVAMVFRVTGYDPDCGETSETATMARLEQVDLAGETTGLEVERVGLYDTADRVVSEPSDLRTIGLPVEEFLFEGHRSPYSTTDGEGAQDG
jgi:hypothetical protein